MKRGEDPAIVVELKALRVSVATLQNALNNSQAQLAAKEQEVATIKATYSKQIDSQQTYHNQSATAWQQSEATKNTSLIAKTQEVQTLTTQLAKKTAECQTLTNSLASIKTASDAKDIVIATSKLEYKVLEDKAKLELKTLSDKSLSEYKLLEDKTTLEYHTLEAKDKLEFETLKMQLKTSITNNGLMQKYVTSLEKDKEELRYDKDILREDVRELMSSVKDFYKKDTHEVAQEVILDKSFSMNEHSHVEFLQSDVEIKVEDSIEENVLKSIMGDSIDSFQEL